MFIIWYNTGESDIKKNFTVWANAVNFIMDLIDGTDGYLQISTRCAADSYCRWESVEYNIPESRYIVGSKPDSDQCQTCYGVGKIAIISKAPGNRIRRCPDCKN